MWFLGTLMAQHIENKMLEYPNSPTPTPTPDGGEYDDYDAGKLICQIHLIFILLHNYRPHFKNKNQNNVSMYC